MTPRYALPVLSLLIISKIAFAQSITLTGKLSDANQVFISSFTLTKVSQVNIQTWSYGGGIDAQGVEVREGGFDPNVTLFSGSGAHARLWDQNDDGECPPGHADSATIQCMDSTLKEIGLKPGIYTIALTAHANLAKGDTLGDGFTGEGTFIDVMHNDRSKKFVVDIVITPSR
jgi:hypothetical protein